MRKVAEKIDLPDNWVRGKIQDLIKIRNGYAFKSKDFQDEDGAPVIRQTNLSTEIVNFKKPKYLPSKFLDEHPEFKVVKGDVLIGLSGSIGNLSRYVEDQPALQNQRTGLLVELVPGATKFVQYYLQLIKKDLLDAAKGVAVQNISSKTIENWGMPIAPLDQQKRIVAKIEELFSHIDAGIEALNKAKQLLKQYRQSVLKAAVTGELTKEWREARIKDDAQGSANVAGGRTPGATKLEPASQLLERILQERRQKWEAQQLEQFKAKGKMPKDDKWKGKYKLEEPNPHMEFESPKEWAVSTIESITDPVRVICYGILMPKENVENGVLYVKVKDVKFGRVLVDQLNRTAPEIAEKYARASLVEGDLLLTIRGTYGRTAIAPKELTGGNITQDTVRISAIEPILNEYLIIFVDSVVAQQYFKVVARGVAVKGVNVQDVRNMNVPIPSVQEQEKIIELVDQKITTITHVEKELEGQLIKAEKNKQSILASAFSGDLN
ncbi:MAG: hypothetical protein GY746_15675 [Gammaproteobacteria bacterium]|nr:hypothetical protein [Gammaproteobacteria bacterium]